MFKTLVLASQSPRRNELMKIAGYNFNIKVSDVDETILNDWNIYEAPKILAKKKAAAVIEQFNLGSDTVVIAADTIVVCEDKVFGKPKNVLEATQMLETLSGKVHEVITGVNIRTPDFEVSFDDLSRVFFRTLDKQELEYYIKNHNPFDKAGGYGIQDWIGVRIVERIEGCYFNVMGMPMRKVIEALKQFGITGMNSNQIVGEKNL